MYWGSQMHSMRILVLGSENPARREVEKTLTRMGHVVMSADPGALRTVPTSGEVVILDLRTGSGHELADALHGDPRPLIVISDEADEVLRALLGRPGGTMMLTGSETDAGYRVALSVCRALSAGRDERPSETPLAPAVR